MTKLHRVQHMFAMLKHLGYTKWWSHYKGGSYETATQIGSYKVEIQKDLPYIDILIWNPDKPCIHMMVDTDYKIAVLNSVGYSPSCTVDGHMKRGEGTRKMIEFAFKLAKEYGATKIQLMDKSSFDCNGQDVDLSIYSLFKYGKTWYEKQFNFYPTGKYADEFEEMRSKLPKIDKPCTFFTESVIQSLSKEYNMNVRFAVTFEKKL